MGYTDYISYEICIPSSRSFKRTENRSFLLQGYAGTVKFVKYTGTLYHSHSWIVIVRTYSCIIWQLHDSTFGSAPPHLLERVTLAHTYTFWYTCSHLHIWINLQLFAIVHLLLPHLASEHERPNFKQLQTRNVNEVSKPFQNQTIFTAVLSDHTGGGEQPPNAADAAALFTKARVMPLPGHFHAW